MAGQRIHLRKVQKLLRHQDFGTTGRIYAKHCAGYLEPTLAIIDEALGEIEPEKLVDARAQGPRKKRISL